MHILSLVTDNNPSWMNQRKGENDHRNHFMINLHESMVPDRDRTRDPWICSQTRIWSQTRYRLRYAARRVCDSLMGALVIRMIPDIWGAIMKLTWWASIGIHATFRGHPHQHANMHHPQQQLDDSYFNIDLSETPTNKKTSTRNEQHMVKLSILIL